MLTVEFGSEYRISENKFKVSIENYVSEVSRINLNLIYFHSRTF